MKISVYQNNPIFGEVEKNLKKAVEDLSAIDSGLVVAPELFCTGYQFVSKNEIVQLSEEVPGGITCETMLDLAKKNNIFIVFGMVEKAGSKFYNSAIIAGPDGMIGRYRKSHLFFDEKNFFDAGDTGFQVFNINGVCIGIMICFDWWFPESARALSLLGADIICHPANLVLPQCQKAMLTRSLENGVFSVTANRIGSEARASKSELKFTGKSQVIAPDGKIIAKMDENYSGVVTTIIQPEEARDKKITILNDRFADRRPELYNIITDPELIKSKK